MAELEKIYNPNTCEKDIYALWEESGYFNPDNAPKKAKKTFTIMMPPPNATGVLHIGHSLMLVIQDLLIRYHRMLGEKALWLPGTDHASIATQNKVEKILAKEGITRHDLGREDFLKRIDEYVTESRDTIRSQIRLMGSSCDWSRERYTLDEGLSYAVREIFIRMYNDGILYRQNRIVNWCPRCMSTLADDEVEYKEEKTPFYYIKFGPVIIGTARPETKFHDKTVVVHPDDTRYKHLVGTEFTFDWINGEVTGHVIADTVAHKDFGTGAMTITPAHSFEDFELATKYSLPVVQIIDEQGNFTSVTGDFKGKNARESRGEIVEILQQKGLIDRIDDNYVHNLSICYRCSTPVEPLPSLQWFVAVDKKIERLNASLKELTAKAVTSSEVAIVPKRFEKTYFQWIDNLRDWCISRQIWFGHQLPVYYCQKERNGCGAIMVAHEQPKTCSHCKNEELIRDPDTLDTWFSSGIWTFSTLGWPQNVEEKHGKITKKGDLATFHPTSVLETGKDIIFFWVARMIMMTYYALGEKPFSTVYLHGMVLDSRGKKMSKSKEETAIDPLTIISTYGTDAVRLSMLAGIAPGNNLRLFDEKLVGYRNFINKLWNISRFILSTSVQEATPHKKVKKLVIKDLCDQWIISRLERVTQQVTLHFEKYQFSQALEELYSFTWNDLADWYLEIAKRSNDKSTLLLVLLERILVLWHPFIPFVTETIYQQLPKKYPFLMIHQWILADSKHINLEAEKEFEIVKNVIHEIRNARAEKNILYSQLIQALIYSPAHEELLKDHEHLLKSLGRIDLLTFVPVQQKLHNALTLKLSGIEIYLPLGMLKVEDEKKRITQELEKIQTLISGIGVRLSNPTFLEKAPKHIVQKEQQRISQYEQLELSLKDQLEKLS